MATPTERLQAAVNKHQVRDRNTVKLLDALTASLTPEQSAIATQVEAIKTSVAKPIESE